MTPLTEDEAAIGLALNGAGAQMSIAPAADGKPIGYVYVHGSHVATVAGPTVAGLLRNLAWIAEHALTRK